MTRSSIPTSVVRWAVLTALAFTAPSSIAQAANKTEDPPPAPQSALLSCGDAVLSQPHVASSHPHSVTLSWNAAVPVSNAPQDAIQGYHIYRSLISHSYAESNRINHSPLQTTRCVDTTVEPRKTYFYVVKSVTAGGKQSDASGEIKAVVPFP